MAINLGKAFVEMTPKWNNLDQRSVENHVKKLNAPVKVEADTRSFKIKVADALGTATGKAVSVPLKAVTAPFMNSLSKDTRESAQKVADSLTRHTQSGLQAARGKFARAGKKVAEDVESGATPGMKDAAKKSADGFGNVLKGTLGAMGIASLISGAMGTVKDLAGTAFEEAQEAIKTGAQTEAVIKSTGKAAGVSAEQVGKLAEALSNKTGIDDEQIQAGANMMLTFTNVRNAAGKNKDIFNQSVVAAQDMATAMGTDTKSAALMLGKALNDPIKGMTRLQRSGVTFTDQQKKQVKALQDQGKMAEAQSIILAEVNKEFGGSAEAQATAADRAKVAWANTLESLGTMAMPAINKLLGVFNDRLMPFISNTLLPMIEKFGGYLGDKLGPILGQIGQWVMANVIPALAQLGGWVQANILPALVKLGGFIRDNVLPLLAQIGGLIVQEIVPRLGQLVGFLIANVFPIIGALWAKVFKPTIEGIIWAIKNLLLPTIDDIGKWLSKVWTGAIAPTLTKFMNFFTDKVVPAFKRGAGGITTAFENLRSNIAKPINFVIGTIYNNGIRKLVNAIISLFGGTGLPEVPMIALSSLNKNGGGGGGGGNQLKMKDGGILPGYTPGRDVHEFYSPTGGRLSLSGGEPIMRPEFGRLMGGEQGIARLNWAARQGAGALSEALGHSHFKDGGIWGKVKDTGKAVWNKAKSTAGNLKEGWDLITSAPGKIKGWRSDLSTKLGNHPFGGYLKNAMLGAVDKVKSWIDTAAEKLGFSGGGGVPGQPVPTFDPGGRVRVGGSILDASTWAKVQAAQKLAGFAFNITQGSYRPRTSYSGGTHMGGGAFDMVGGNLAVANSALRKSGFASWVRDPSQGPWPYHIHALEMGNKNLSPSAAGQVQSYLRGGNGLGGYASGVKSAMPGWAMIDERGDEWVKFGGGETVLPHGRNPIPAAQRLVGEMRITNWEQGIAEFQGQVVDELDWRGTR